MLRRRMLGFPVLVTLALIVVHHVSSAQTLSPQQMGQVGQGSSGADPITSTADVLLRMDGSRTTIRRMLEEARKQRDVIKTLCLDDKLNQIDIALRSARDQKATIDAAVQRNDLELAIRQTTTLNVLRERTDQLVVEANLCISRETEAVGPAALLVDIDPHIADEPAYYPPGIIIIEPPPTGSVIK